MTDFVHLSLHSEYSIIDSIIPIGGLCEQVKNLGMKAVALTDVTNLFGMVKFYKACLEQGIKPIVGAEIWLENEEHPEEHFTLTVLCQNLEGYWNLTRLISLTYQEGVRTDIPLTKKKWLAQHASGLIALSGGKRGDVGNALLQNSFEKAATLLSDWMEIFPNRFYIEIQRTSRQDEQSYEKVALKLAQEQACPIVATNDVTFLFPDDYEAHNARVSIQEGTTLEQSASSNRYSRSQYLKSPVEMATLFADLPQAIENSVNIAKRCSLTLTLDKTVLPSFPVPSNMTEESYLEKASLEGLEARLKQIIQQKQIPQEQQDEFIKSYKERLHLELGVINSMGFPGYFLIVADFIQWAKSNLIPVGPGRGSGAGSLVAYALSITDLDPIEYELLFERFLNPERVSLPDFDIDFCMDNRDRVIEYVTGRYGRNNVSQIATFGTMAAKAVIRDVGRVLGHPYGFVDKIAKLIPFEIGMTLEKALSQEQTLKQRYDNEEEVKTLIDLASRLEGITRNVGKHAGGVVIAPSALTDFAPLYCDKNTNQVVIQFDKDDVESIGLIKFDFLGLRTLTIIDWAVKNVNVQLAAKNAPLIDIQSIRLDDPETFELLKRCSTTAVFQLESRGMKELIKRLQPDQFEEIIALVALFRPGPLQSGMVDDFINRKHKRAKVEYLHPAIEPILKPTYGVILYQEQVMQIAQTLAGYTLGGADLLRRAMGKKKPEEMAKQRAIFTEGSVQNGVDEKTATYIFDLMEKFAGYGFNKSHSAAYALVSYQTAWLKAHYPSAFMAAVLSADMNHTDKIVTLIEECKQCQIKVLPPDINHSHFVFTVNQQDEIVYGLGAIKGVGEAAVHHIIEVRQSGAFSNLFEFCERVDSKKVNKRVNEALIKSGAFDCFGQERALMMALLDSAVMSAEQQAKNSVIGQNDLFQFNEERSLTVQAQSVKPWSPQEKLQGESESLGMYFSGHPLLLVEHELQKMGVVNLGKVTLNKKEQKSLIAGIVLSIKTMQTKNGERMAIIVFDDANERSEIAIFPQVYQSARELLVKDQLLIIDGLITLDPASGSRKIRAQALYGLDTARELFAKNIIIKFASKLVTEQSIHLLKECFTLYERGNCPIYIEYHNHDATVRIKLGQQWNVKPSEEIITQINTILDSQAASISY
ncbi:MAG: DNA polymerase III subunit alpha [Candidatus Berkiella sp.]